MGEEKLLTVRDVSFILGVSEREVMDLAERGAIPAYKVGGVYLRFKKEQIVEFKKLLKIPSYKNNSNPDYPLKDKISDFLYFNDFYIFSILIIGGLLIIIFQGY